MGCGAAGLAGAGAGVDACAAWGCILDDCGMGAATPACPLAAPDWDGLAIVLLETFLPAFAASAFCL